MTVEYAGVNTNKLHDELIASGIVPVLVQSLDNTTWITYADGVNMDAVQSVIDAHDSSPVMPILSTEERLAQMAQRLNDATDTLLETQYAVMLLSLGC